MHVCDAIVISCMDFRLHPTLSNMIRGKVASSFDEVFVPGAVKGLVHSEPAVRDFLLRSIEISERLHNACKVILVNHTDCGAYGGRAAFESDEAELAAHKKDLHLASSIIRERFPNLEVVCMIAVLGENYKELRLMVV